MQANLQNAFAIKEFPCMVGRDPKAHVFLMDTTVSRQHLKIDFIDNHYSFNDLNSTHGCRLNGQESHHAILQNGDLLMAGMQKIRIHIQDQKLFLELIHPDRMLISIPWPQDKPISIGRGITCDINPGIPTLPKHFLKIKKTANHFEIAYAAGLKIRPAPNQRLSTATSHTLYFPGFSLRLTPEALSLHRSAKGPALRCENINYSVGPHSILKNISFGLGEACLTGILGASGQGKSTLMKILALQIRPDSGNYFALRSQKILNHKNLTRAWLSQKSPLHQSLTVREILKHEIKLKLPGDYTQSESDQIITKALELAELSHRADSLVESLSGGEYQRCALCAELISDPGLLFLDEPTTGLDPLSDTRLFDHLKRITRQGQSVVMSTHNPEHILFFDQVLLLQEGHLIYSGSPAEALKYFNCQHPADLMSCVAAKETRDNLDRFQQSQTQATSILTKLANSDEISWTPQIRGAGRSVFNRFFKQNFRDQGRRYSLLLQPILLGLCFILLFNPLSSPWAIAFSLSLCALWFSMSLAIREISFEKEILRRELQAGLSPLSYLMAKTCAISLSAFLQTLLCFLIFHFFLKNPLDYPMLALGLGLSVVSASLLGLLFSALSSTAQQAVSMLPLLLIPQLMFAGLLVGTEKMNHAGYYFSGLIQTRWYFSFIRDIYTGSGLRFDLLWPPLVLTLFFFILVLILLFRTKKSLD
jgi:ABC-type multidrug transport system ATPase subunit